MTIHQFMRAKPGTSFLLFVIFLILVCALAPTLAHAQTLRFVTEPCAYDFSRKTFENYIGDGHSGGFVARRYQHHIVAASISTATAVGIRKVTKLPPWASATIAVATIGFVPHIRQHIRGNWDINIRDWAADGWIRSAPAWFVIGHDDKGHAFKSHALAATTYLGGYFALAPCAHP